MGLQCRFPCQRRARGHRCTWSFAAVREALTPTIRQGNGTHEKTTRCPDGWSVRCRCFCTSPSRCTRPRPRSRACSDGGAHGSARACSSPGSCHQGRQGTCQGQAQESGRQENQEGRQESRLITVARAGPAVAAPVASKSPAFAGVSVFGLRLLPFTCLPSFHIAPCQQHSLPATTPHAACLAPSPPR